MSLRDQLLKAGAVNKKQALKAEKGAKKARIQKQVEARQGKALPPHEDFSRIHQEQLEQQREKDRLLNLEIQKKKDEQFRKFQIRDLILAHDETPRFGDERYYYKAPQNEIHFIEVETGQVEQLARGRLGIVSGTLVACEHLILPSTICEQVRDFDESLILCLHPGED